jgi:hypothetical protein
MLSIRAAYFGSAIVITLAARTRLLQKELVERGTDAGQPCVFLAWAAVQHFAFVHVSNGGRLELFRPSEASALERPQVPARIPRDRSRAHRMLRSRAHSPNRCRLVVIEMTRCVHVTEGYGNER